MTFNPTLEVICGQPAVRNAPDLSFEAILRHFPSFAEAEAVCRTGSTAAGWGNTFSDIDLYVFADKELDLPADETAESSPSWNPSGIPWHRWIGVYDNTRVDLKVWRTDALDTVLAPYLGTEPEFSGMEEDLQDFIYRISIGIPLKNEGYFQRMRELVTSSSYRRALARDIKAGAENALTDVAGQLDSGDYLTARLSALRAAEFTADACLVLAGQLCRGRKWLLHRLDSTPECGMGSGEYRSIVLDGARSAESDGDYARRVARWAQSHIVRLEDAFLTAS